MAKVGRPQGDVGDKDGERRAAMRNRRVMRAAVVIFDCPRRGGWGASRR